MEDGMNECGRQVPSSGHSHEILKLEDLKGTLKYFLKGNLLVRFALTKEEFVRRQEGRL